MQPTLTMKTPPAADADTRPWYRHRWPWLLAIAPAAALVGGIVMLWLAITTTDSLVVDDYYREGRAINQQLARDRLAAALGLSAQLRFEGGNDPVVVLQLAAERGTEWPRELSLRIVHATIASHDLDYHLEHVGNGRYRAPATAPEPGGRWLVQIEDPGRTWRLVAPVVTRFDTPLALQASTP